MRFSTNFLWPHRCLFGAHFVPVGGTTRCRIALCAPPLSVKKMLRQLDPSCGGAPLECGRWRGSVKKHALPESNPASFGPNKDESARAECARRPGKNCRGGSSRSLIVPIDQRPHRLASQFRRRISTGSTTLFWLARRIFSVLGSPQLSTSLTPTIGRAKLYTGNNLRRFIATKPPIPRELPRSWLRSFLRSRNAALLCRIRFP